MRGGRPFDRRGHDGGAASRLYRRWTVNLIGDQDDGGPVNSRLQDTNLATTVEDGGQVTIWAQQRNLQASVR